MLASTSNQGIPPGRIHGFDGGKVRRDPGVRGHVFELEIIWRRRHPNEVRQGSRGIVSDSYVGGVDSNSEAEILAAAAWIEARKKIFLCNTSDTEVVDNVVTSDVMSDLQSFAYARTAIMYSQVRLLNWSGAAWGGNRLPSDPGSSTWAFKTLAGVQVDQNLTGGQASVIESKGGNHYTVVAGVNITRYGIMASGEFIDIVRGIDWLDQRIKERIFGVLINNPKVPYTDTGVDLMRSQVLAQLNQGVGVGLLSPDPAPVVTAPKVADIDPADRANRILPDINFQATLAGAIHKLIISGVLSV